MHCVARHTSDVEGLSDIWQRHESEIHQRCLGWTGRRDEEAREALCRTAMAAVKSYREVAPRLLEPRAWLLRLAYNVCMDLHRARKREKLQAIEDLEDRGDAALSVPDGTARNPEATLLQAELHTFLRRSVGELPARLREPMRLHLFGEASYREIALRLTLTEANVRKRIQHGREHLRQRLQAYLAGSAEIPSGQVRPAEPVDLPAADPGPGEVRTAAASWRIAALRPVRLRLPSGLEKDLELCLHEPPCRATPQRIDSLRSYVLLHPRGWKKRLELARLLREGGDLEQAAAEYRLVAAREAVTPLIWVELGTTLRDLGQPSEALAVFEKAARTSPEASTRHHFEGLAALCRESWTEATQAFRAAADGAPGHLTHPLTLGRACLRIGRISESVEALEQALAIDPDDPVALLSSHDALMAAGRPLAARARIERAAELDELGAPALVRLIAHRCAAGELEGEEGLTTRKLLQQLRQLGGGQADADAVTAHYRLLRGDARGAGAALAARVAAHPRHPRYRLHYARLLFQTGQTERAAEEVLAALALDSEDGEICRTAWDILSRSGRLADAADRLDETLRRRPDDWLLVTAAATGCLRAGRPAEADRLSLAAVELQPRLPASWLLRGRVLRHQRRTAEAAASLERGWPLLPSGDGFALSTVMARLHGRIWGLRGDPRRAQAWYRTALEHAASLALSDPAGAFAERGRALEGLGNAAAAVVAYRTALRRSLLHPEHSRIQAALRRLAFQTTRISQEPVKEVNHDCRETC